MILSILVTILAFLFILTVVVIIHEAGHFFVARRFGIKVEEFGFGFPPRAFAKKIGETLYSINWFPLGGFVKLYGEDDAGGGSIKIKDQRSKIKDTSRAFFARPAWQRACVIVAGVVMNLLLSFAVFYVFLFASGFRSTLPLIVNHNFFFSDQKINANIYASLVEKNSPADKIGLKPTDKFISIDGKKVASDEEFIGEVNKNKGREISLIWTTMSGKTKQANVVPRVNPPKNQGPLGVGLFPYAEVEVSYNTFPQKLFSGITYPLNLLVYNLEGIKSIISTSVHQKTLTPVKENVSGPLGIFVVVGSVISGSSDVKQTLLQGLNIIGLISISLAFFNVLPIPALDGGRLFFVLIEMFTGKKLNPKKEAIINNVGFIVLLALVILISVFFDLPKFQNYLGFLFKH